MLMKKLITTVSCLLCLITFPVHAQNSAIEEACQSFQSIAEHFVSEQQHGVKQQELIQLVEHYEKFSQNEKDSLFHMLNFIYSTFDIEQDEINKQQLTTIFGERAYNQCMEKIIK